MQKIRNIAIVAHVDHGKTTLIDALLKQSGTFRDNQVVSDRIMDSNDLERERGITITAKCTSVIWDKIKINIIDTPGHADFGGEVERILSMVDGALLLVDAAEGPFPQTKFVLGKALRLGLKPIVVINKIDRQDERHNEVLNEIFDLFVALDANEKQLDFPVMYASGRSGWAVNDLEKEEKKDLKPLFNMILKHVEEPKNIEKVTENFSMLVTTREYDPYLGRILTGRINSGTLKENMSVSVFDQNGETVENGRITKILSFAGVERVQTNEAKAGDIIVVAGLEKTSVADIICAVNTKTLIKAEPLDSPKLSINISVNDSPFAGTEGSKVTFRMLYDRLLREAEGNVAINVKISDGLDSVEVAGRGELQLGVLIETMRREGFELSISRPKVLMKVDEKTQEKQEPFEEIYIDVDDEFVGEVVKMLSERRAEMKEMKHCGVGRTRIIFVGPARGLIGFHNKFLTETRGSGIINHLFHSYQKYTGPFEDRRNGVLISTEQGECVAYGLFYLEPRGTLFVEPGTKVYKGMIVGEHTRDNDLEVNPLKSKQLTNMRASGKDEAIKLRTKKMMTLEQALTYIQDDELVEVTPKSIRLRKAILDSNERKKAERISMK